MSKKSFAGGFDSLLGNSVEQVIVTENRGRPKSNFKEVVKSSQEGTKEGETRATFIVKEELLEKIKSLAYWERVLLKDVVNAALYEYIQNYEDKNGAINPIPKAKNL